MEDRSEFDVAQICLSGHLINDRSREHPEDNEDFCASCGEKTIRVCPVCRHEIRGACTVIYADATPTDAVSADDAGYFPLEEIPAFCTNCGSPFPWTEMKKREFFTIIDETKSVRKPEREKLKLSIEDLIKGINVQLGSTRLKLFLQKAGQEAAETLKSLLISFLSAAIRKQIGL